MARRTAARPEFFDDYPRFVESSEPGPWLERLNARHAALIEHNRDLLEGARVLDLAGHDGRFAFAAVKAGAAHVTTIDVKTHLARAGEASMAHYGIEPDRYEFKVGDLFDYLATGPDADVVFCFGILYHLPDHMRLLTAVAELGPKAVILDTNVSQLDGAVIQLQGALGDSPPAPGAFVEGVPTTAAIDAMATSLGWEVDYFDWQSSELLACAKTGDYAEGNRVSVRFACPDHHVPDDTRDRAVQDVLDSDHDRERDFIAITMVAENHGISPQSLRLWVDRARRQRSRERGFTD